MVLVTTEDAWVDGKFGKIEENEEGNNGRTILCEFRHWTGVYGVTPELEEVSAKDPLARESWVQAVAKVMPPVTAWEQERWDIRVVPSFESPEEDEDEAEEEEEDAEWNRKLVEFCEQPQPDNESGE